VVRIRIHARGGQGAKTASRVLGAALFAEGLEVQDAPRYGAERRGAPIFAYVRADRDPIRERGAIVHPDLVVVADPTLIRVASAGVLAGVGERTVLLIRGPDDAETWRERLKLPGPIIALEPVSTIPADVHLVGVHCAGAAARLLGNVSRAALTGALRDELAALGPLAVAESLELALSAYEAMEAQAGCVTQAPAAAPGQEKVGWIDVPLELASVSAPDIHGAATSVQVRTGLWRTMRPVIDLDRCRHCHWVCSTQCPDGAIDVLADGAPEIDYEHCKGCMICVAVCPTHAIRAVPETLAQREASEGA